MQKLLVLSLLLLIGGCLPAPPEMVTRDPAFAVPAETEPATLATNPALPAASFILSSAPPSAAPAVSIPAATTVLTPEAAANALLAAGTPAAEEELTEEELAEEEPLADPETIEDAEILAGEDLAPPEDEGQTLPAETPFDFPVVKNDKVLYYVDYFSGPAQKVFKRWLERSARYLPMMQKTFAEEGLPQDLVYLAMIESGFNNRAYSWAHAAGPWQFIEGTGRLYGLDNDWWRDERRDPVKATRAAARHLKDLYNYFERDWYLAVAAYNAGSGKIGRAVEMYGTRDFWELSHGSYLQPETKNYLPKLLAALLIAKEPEKYGFTELEYLPPFDFETVKVPTTTDLEIIANLSGSSYDEIKDLNPELKRWSTPPGVKNYEVRIPAGNRDAFVEKYALLPENRRASYQHHKIRSGDTLLGLARRYGIRVADIVSLNKISNPRALRVGTDLILPLQKGGSTINVADLGDDYQRSRRQTPKSYKVRSGDSLWKIARRFGVSEKELKGWNRLGSKSVLRPGQTLVVSATSGRQAVAAKQSEAKKTVAKKSDAKKTVAKKSDAKKTVAKKGAAPQKIVYKVRPGDTIFGIGRQFKVAARQIMDWNNLSENHILQPGDRLTLLLQGEHRS
ncbi:MAG TPA: LysM peptidoglycan-binding domain-containing protein [Desulfuromonadales bacterium]|nr:LysM peptidoglycan-binding domain-containing protein [Desulfuromonadales bacterium]